jgi:Zn-dependent peptidase ImmA (M78 family)
MDEMGVATDELAAQLETSVEEVDAWLSGRSRPSTGQFRRLAKYLGRPETTFLLREPPADAGVPPSFRHPPGTAPGRTLTRDEAQAVRTARRLQRIARWVSERLPGEADAVDIPEVRAMSRPTLAGETIADWVEWPVARQTEAEDTYAVIRDLRERLESRGVLVFHLRLGHSGCRGFSLPDPLRPVLAVNTGYTPEARLFSYGHELAHLASRTQAICVGYEGTQLERWCERVAGAMFLPSASVTAWVAEEFGDAPLTERWEAQRVARRYKTSLSATIIRLIELGLGSQALGAFVNHQRDRTPTKSSGGKGERSSERRHREWGEGYSHLLLDAEQRGLLRSHVMLEYLDLPQSQLEEWRALARGEPLG